MSKVERRKALGNWLKIRREQAGLTQSALASALHYDNAQIISNIERGVSAIPQKRINDFAKALGTDSMELNFRVLASNVTDSVAAQAADLALEHFPLLLALNKLDQNQRNAAVEEIKARFDLKNLGGAGETSTPNNFA